MKTVTKALKVGASLAMAAGAVWWFDHRLVHLNASGSVSRVQAFRARDKYKDYYFAGV